MTEHIGVEHIFTSGRGCRANVVQLGQNVSNSTRGKIFREFGEMIKSQSACPFNQISLQCHQRSVRSSFNEREQEARLLAEIACQFYAWHCVD